ncbi:hypothetical protein [Salipaludibacillus sp. CF4.18]
MTMKKIPLLSLTVVLVSILGACGSESTEQRWMQKTQMVWKKL